MSHESRYGLEPFEKLTKAVFELRGLDSQKYAAYLQYRLMLLDSVIRVHIDYVKKTAEIIYDNPTKNTESVLATIKPVRAILKSKETVDYDELVAKGYHG